MIFGIFLSAKKSKKGWFWVRPILSFDQVKFEKNWLENKVALLKKPKK